MRYQIAVVTSYLAFMSLLVYGVLDRHASEGALLLPVIAIAQLAVGFASGRWYAFLLPLAVVFISVPAGFPPVEDGEPLPLWFDLAWGLVVAIPLVVAGIVARKMYERRQATEVTT